MTSPDANRTADVFQDAAVLEEVRNAVEAACEARHLDENTTQAIIWRTQAVLERRARGDRG